MRGSASSLLLLTACRSTVVEQHVQRIQVATEPPAALIRVEDSNGIATVGASPLEIERPYKVTRQEFDHKCWNTPLVATGASVLGLIVGSAQGWDTKGSTSGLAVASGIALGGGLITAVFGAIFCGASESTAGRTEVEPKAERIKLIASREGFLDEARVVSVPGKNQTVRIELTSRGPSGPPPGEPKAAEPSRPPAPIVAVLEIEDGRGRLEPRALDQLSEYLATKLASGGYQVVPRDRLRRRLLLSKAEGYRPCVDESCQIELGKAVAAQKTLATKVLGVGAECTLTSTLYDLRLEVAERAALARSACDTEALVAGIDRLVSELR
jgi:hypothetical protein